MSESYIIHTYPCIKAQLDYVNGVLCEGLDKNTRWLFCHILVSHMIKKLEPTPVSAELIKSKLQGASWRLLESAGLISASDYSIGEHLCREYSIPLHIINSYVTLGDLPLVEDIREDRYNLMTGRKSNRAKGSELTDDNNNAHPTLIVEAVKSIEYNYINLLDIETHVKKLEAERDAARLSAIKYPDNLVLSLNAIRANCRYINDWSCYKSIIAQSPKEMIRGIYFYYPPYSVQMSGRISSIGGMMQSCSREMKAIAYKDIENINNYDLRASQVSGLIQQFELAGLDCSWLINYRNPSVREEYATRIGISIKCWKDMVCSTIMGSYLPKNIKRALKKIQSQGSLSAVLDSLNKEFAGDEAKVMNALIKFIDVISPLKKQIDLWHQWLLDVYIPKVGFKLRRSSDIYISNPTGIKLNVTTLVNENEHWKVKSVIAAFILQGQEAAFIHHLTVLSVKYEYQVIQNEHDGLVTLGDVPNEAVQEASILSGLKYCEFPKKDFT